MTRIRPQHVKIGYVHKQPDVIVTSVDIRGTPWYKMPSLQYFLYSHYLSNLNLITPDSLTNTKITIQQSWHLRKKSLSSSRMPTTST